jgi:hypothetical protein
MKHWLSICLFAGVLSACGIFSTRPEKQMSYAEAAYQAATVANAESLASNVYQLARDSLLRARSAYRAKDFKSARILALQSRHLSEEAELKSLKSEKNFDIINPPGAMPPSDNRMLGPPNQ